MAPNAMNGSQAAPADHGAATEMAATCAHQALVAPSEDPGFRRYVAADADRERIAMSGSAEEINALVSAYPAYKEAERANYGAIVAAHPNFVELAAEPAFAAFVDAVGAQTVVDSGSAEEIIALLDRYVVVRPAPEQLAQPAAEPGVTITVDDSPREWHALSALMTGPKSREEIDRAAGVSNGPDLIMELRRRHALGLPCKRVNHKDRWGVSVKKGVYSLSETDRPKVARLLHKPQACTGHQSFYRELSTLSAEARAKAVAAAKRWLAEQPPVPPLPVGNPFIDACVGSFAAAEGGR